ncbi:hypothetical protein SDC9_44353 [bioreactor metagenome]|uniref:Uncharacterized protein n=1 Tax=bioreactor metagenome TaxID=1076179 RepID=A0A644W6V5_9ZZZZ
MSGRGSQGRKKAGRPAEESPRNSEQRRACSVRLSEDQVGQDQDDPGEENEDDHQGKEGKVKGNGLPGGLLGCASHDLRRGVQGHAHRRRHDSRGQGGHHDDPEMDGVDAEPRNHRNEHRRQEHGADSGLHEHSGQNQQQDDQEEEKMAVRRDADEEFRDGLGNPPVDDGIPEGSRQAEDEHEDADVHGALLHRLQEALPGHLPVDEDPDENGVPRGEGPRLRGCEEAEPDSHDEDDGEDQGKDVLPQCGHHLPGIRLPYVLPGHVAPPLGREVHGEHHHGHHEESGDDASHKEAADGHLSHGAVDDEAHARRDSAGDHGGQAVDRRAVAPGIPLFDHLRAEDSALHDGVGVGRSGHAPHEGAQDDADLGEAARHVPHEHPGELHQPGGDARGVHEVSGEDEERDGQEGEALGLGHDALHRDGNGDVGRGQHEGEARQPDGEGHGHAEEEEHQENADEKKHTVLLLPTPRPARRPGGWTGSR